MFCIERFPINSNFWFRNNVIHVEMEKEFVTYKKMGTNLFLFKPLKHGTSDSISGFLHLDNRSIDNYDKINVYSNNKPLLIDITLSNFHIKFATIPIDTDTFEITFEYFKVKPNCNYLQYEEPEYFSIQYSQFEILNSNSVISYL